MPAQIVLVHDAPRFLERAAAALGSAGHSVAAFRNPLPALDAFEAARTVEVLITGVMFGLGQSNGAALARTARAKRPQIRIIFTELPETKHYTHGMGLFWPCPWK